MSIIGAVSLTNNTGLFLGEVNLNNLNLASNQLVYSSDGVNMSGLNIGDGLQKVLDELTTVGNPDIQLTSNSLYVNDNVNSIQSAVNQATQADVINISSGSFGESQIQITDKYNIGLTAPGTASTICEILNGVVIDGTSENIRLSNLQIKGANSRINGVGRHRLNNCVFTGSVSQTNNVEFGNSSTNFITVSNCEFNNYCSLTVSNLFASVASVIYFINCNFGGATITLSQPSPLQVIFNNCAGFVSFPLETKASFIGLNVLTTGVSRTDTTNVNLSTINNLAYPPTISLPAGVLKQFYYLSAQTPTQSAVTIDIGTPVQLSFDITKYYKITVIYNFNVLSGGGGGISQCTFALRDNDDTTLQQMEFNLAKPHQTITIIFYVQPLLASSILYLLISSPDGIENSSTDRIIWDIQEVQ
jgi:hypothetical protein